MEGGGPSRRGRQEEARTEMLKWTIVSSFLRSHPRTKDGRKTEGHRERGGDRGEERVWLEMWFRGQVRRENGESGFFF